MTDKILNNFLNDILERQKDLPVGELENLKQIKNKHIKDIDLLLEKAQKSLKNMMAEVFYAETTEDALRYIDHLLPGDVVKSYSATLKEIGLKEHLRFKGIKLMETRLEDYLTEVLQVTPVHPLYPLAHIDREQIENMIIKHFNLTSKHEISTLIAKIKEQILAAIEGAQIGITGANAVLADTGTIMIMEEQGNARLVSNLPPVHVVVVGIDKLFSSGEEALAALRAASICGAGKSMLNYISYISGPSKTGDIAFQLVKGMHGPKEVHVILLDNGRKKASGM